jgi:tRNA threonylcarbamoyladenosine biosynthesis protein TsaB
LNIPLLAVSTLQSLAAQAQTDADFIVPMLDARRMEVYSAVFTAQLEKVRDTQAELLDEKSISSWLEKGTVHFIGNGVSKFRSICDHPNAQFNERALPSAKEMVALAFSKYKAGDTEDVAYFEPFYLKDFLIK